MDATTLVATVTGVVSALGVPIAYLQLRDARQAAGREQAPTAEPRLADWGVFAPAARVLGHGRDLVGRDRELRRLVAAVKDGSPVAVIEGVGGVGKTALAAAVCRRLNRSRTVAWVFCEERADNLSLRSLATGLTTQAGLRDTALLATGTARATDAMLSDALIAFLAASRVLLVLDDFHTVRDPAVRAWVARMVHTEGGSTVLLTSSRHLADIPHGQRSAWVRLPGLASADARGFLRRHGVRLGHDALETVWQRAGEGNPQALTLFAGQCVGASPDVLAGNLPAWEVNRGAWIGPLYRALSPDEQKAARAVAFVFEAAPAELVARLAGEAAAHVTELESRFLVTRTPAGIEMHRSVREYLYAQLSEEEKALLSERLTRWYRERARTLLFQGLGEDQPSYGSLYLESFPDYIQNAERHIRLIDDLVKCLEQAGLPLQRGARVLVLGAGNGIHDPGLAKHGLEITNLEIQPEIAALGERQAARLPASIRYITADMTKPLPRQIPHGSMDAVFNLGSAFGFEDTDEENAAVFQAAAAAAKPGAVLVFEYVNGPYWENLRVHRRADVTVLDNGATRTEYSINDPHSRTSLTAIKLQRPDGTGGWLRHFMHYYRLPEITAMMERAGWVPAAIHGERDGRINDTFDERESDGMVIIAIRA